MALETLEWGKDKSWLMKKPSHKEEELALVSTFGENTLGYLSKWQEEDANDIKTLEEIDENLYYFDMIMTCFIHDLHDHNVAENMWIIVLLKMFSHLY